MQYSKKTFPGLDLVLEDIHGERFSDRSICSLIISERSFHKGEKVAVIVWGDYSEEILRECSDKVGKIFSSKNNLDLAEVIRQSYLSKK